MRTVALLSLLVLSVAPAVAAPGGAIESVAAGGEWSLNTPPSVLQLPPNVTLSPLLKVTSDRDAKVYGLSLMSDANRAPLGLAMGEAGKPASGATPYLFRDIASANGVTLFETQGRKVLLLQGSMARNGGRFHLRYLTNGLFMTYSTCDVLLRNEGGQFSMQNAYTGAKVTSVKIISSSLGVTTLQGICPAR